MDDLLPLTKKHMAWASEEGVVAFLRMKPLDFLRLTAGNTVWLAAWINDPSVMRKLDISKMNFPGDFEQQLLGFLTEVGQEVQPLDVYVRAGQTGENRIPPFLNVDIDTGKVQGHEGR